MSVAPALILLAVAALAVLVLWWAARSTRANVLRTRRALESASPGAQVDDRAAQATVRWLVDEGFVVAPEGWRDATAAGMHLVALVRGPLLAVVVTGAIGPRAAFATRFTSGRLLETSFAGIFPLPSSVERQVFLDVDIPTLLHRHLETVAAAEAEGAVPQEVPLAEADRTMIATELEHADHALAGGLRTGLASAWRLERRKHLDRVPVLARSGGAARLARPLD